MISTLKRRASRIGLSNVKIMVNIDVMELIAPNDDSIPNHSMLSVCFERGGKISSTSNKLFNKEELDSMNNPLQTKIVLKSIVFPVYESVAIIATLYKDVKTGAFQEKTGKIILRQLKKNSMFNSESYKGLALYDLRLDELVNDLQAMNNANGTILTSYTVERDLNLDLLTGATLKVIITTNLLNEELEPQEAQDGELTSAMSFMIEDHNIPLEDETIIGATFEDSKAANSRVNSKRRKSRMSYMLVANESSLNLATASSDAGDSPAKINTGSPSYGGAGGVSNNRIITHSISNLFNNDNFTDEAEPVGLSVDKHSPSPRASGMISGAAVSQQHELPIIREERQDSISSPVRTVCSSMDDTYLINNSEGRASMLNRDDIELFQNTIKSKDAEEDIILEISDDESEVVFPSPGLNTAGRLSEEHTIPLDLNIVEAPTPPPFSTSTSSIHSPVVNNRRNVQLLDQGCQTIDDRKENESGDYEEERREAEDSEGDEEHEEDADNKLTIASGVAIKKSKIRIKKIAANKEAFKIFNKELNVKSNRIAALELILTQQSDDYQAKLFTLTEQLQIVEAENKALRDIVNNVDVVRESIVAVQTSSSASAHSYMMLMAGAAAPECTETLDTTNSVPVSALSTGPPQLSVDDIDLADEYLKRMSVLMMPSVDSAASGDEAITYAKYATVVAELQTMKDEVQFLKNNLIMAQQAKAEETAAAREAASEAVRANMRRADMQQENEEVLEELIDLKMKLANMAIDFDQQRLLNMSYQRRIQIYAEQLTSMEVQETIRAHSIAPTESPFKAKLNSTMNGKVVSNASAVVSTSERLLIARRNSAKVVGSSNYNSTIDEAAGAVNESVTGDDKVTVMVKL